MYTGKYFTKVFCQVTETKEASSRSAPEDAARKETALMHRGGDYIVVQHHFRSRARQNRFGTSQHHLAAREGIAEKNLQIQSSTWDVHKVRICRWKYPSEIHQLRCHSIQAEIRQPHELQL